MPGDSGLIHPGENLDGKILESESIREESPLREYIFATYNEEIAKKYEKKPCANVRAKYFRDLSTIREQLKRDMGEI
ncbi:hypothetical protein DAPPUDRAFT_340838 [Daphnia pulex]|uniref:Uncharacterized protein n=1 Tax=Daphnia pulex TaxID=6669 RepID=E9I4T7_DAPPU|nr:hypothetical protein DAPPUDRAFT_340838 [Daphnia pulex]|eukprot:EFX60993.1 hypothetical protein DAPPUDRAFT_340838 [Daphnia pulex]